MAKDSDTIRLGVIGCGGFGIFALQHFAQAPGVRLTGMAGTHREAAYAAAQRFGVPDIVEVDALVARDDVDLIYISTPPFLHYDQGMAALKAGKHVIVEKPLALTLEQADEMIEVAREKGVLLIANLMQRYNPLFNIVRKLIDETLLGELLHLVFENYASDQGLGLDHWFWDRSKSGGIFVEHGVHFFDLVAGWLGDGVVKAAQRTLRPNTDCEEQVHATVQYGDSVIANFYHGFHQTGRMDRQQMKLVFERGEVELFEWIPTRVRLMGLVDEAAARRLMELFNGARLDISEQYPPDARYFRGRHKEFEAFELIEMHYGDHSSKMHLYGRLLRAMIQDQTAWIRDHSHARVITEQNGRDSLAMAVEARRLASGE